MAWWDSAAPLHPVPAALRDQILDQAEKDCKKLKADASARMDKAAQAILGRVVES